MSACPVLRPAPIVVKLGGSVVRSRELEPWLDAIARLRGQIVLVPGGGALAEEVRNEQTRLGFDDAVAHRMALLAMDQLAWALAGMQPGFEVGTSAADLRESLRAGRIAVWAPYQLVANRPDVPQSWAVTSDSLAIWLAGQIGASGCYLIKSITRTFSQIDARELSRQGIVDAAFPEMLAQASVPAFLLGRGEQAGFAAIQDGVAAGAVIVQQPASVNC